ncbi:protein of unknown function [Xenorhabdus poinarii G6]|uniref:Uncharacterized protein n=1 Tax=Xenorhabdus poinarii G6 TaxID=1354304 RepID=A0A068R2L0_9GAMM|nr:protein of unknown function [Xenorhabdus poinarii G6]
MDGINQYIKQHDNEKTKANTLLDNNRNPKLSCIIMYKLK